MSAHVKWTDIQSLHQVVKPIATAGRRWFMERT